MNGTKNLIMGLWARQPFRPLEKFIASLRRTGFAGDVCLCVEEVSGDTVAAMRAHGIHVERVGASAQPRMTSMSSRYFSYLDFLARHGAAYDRVMLTDPVSTVFQSDPFAAPLQAEIVYAQEHRRLGESARDHEAVVQAYGESVAANMRHCMVSSANATIGTISGMLRYLVAMTHELSARTTPITGAIDQGVHNHIVHMRPLRDAWLDTRTVRVAAMSGVPEASVRLSEQGVLINGEVPALLLQWDSNATTLDHVRSAPKFKLDASPPAPVARASSTDAVIAYYQRERDAQWLPLFLASLRSVSDWVAVHCIGDFDQNEQALLSRHGCTAYRVPALDLQLADNVAHFYLNQVLDRLAGERSIGLDQVLVLDRMSAVFPRDPFATKTIGLSVVTEGSALISESQYNRDRLAMFITPDERRLAYPVISSTLLRGTVPVIREFYRHLLAELVGRSHLMQIQKVIQGGFNKLCHDTNLGFPIIAHPNGAEAHFDLWHSDLAMDIRHGVRVGGTVPGVVLGQDITTPLMRKLRMDLQLPAQ